MNISVSAHQGIIQFNFDKKTKKAADLEKPIIGVVKSIFKQGVDSERIKEIYISSGKKRLKVTWVNQNGETQSRPMRELIAKREFEEFKKLIKKFRSNLHVKIDTSQELTKLIATQSPETTKTFHKKTVPAQELPEPTHLRHLEKSSPEGNRLAIFFRRFFAYFLVLKPSANELISHRLERMQPIDYRASFFNLLQESDEWIDRISQQYPRLAAIYNQDELKQLYKKQLTELMNDALKKADMHPLNASELREFTIKNTIVTLQKNTGSLQNLKTKLEKIPAKEMPFEELAKIPVTRENKILLREIWIKNLKELSTIGRLDPLTSSTAAKDTFIQTSCGLKFIEAAQAIPRQLFAKSNRSLQKLNIESTYKALIPFLIQSNAYFNSKIPLIDPALAKKQQIYQEKIKPILENVMRNYHRSPERLMRALTKSINDLDHFIILTRNVLNVDEESKQLFSKVDLTNMFYYAAQKIAIDEFLFSSVQMENIQKVFLKESHLTTNQKEVRNTLLSYANERLEAIQSEDPKEAQKAVLKKYTKRILGYPISPDELLSIIKTEYPSPLILKIYEELAKKFLSTKTLNKINTEKNEGVLKKHMLLIRKLRFQLLEIPKSSTVNQNILENFRNRITNPQAKALWDEKIQEPIFNPDLECYYGDNVIQDIETNGFKHPSKIPPKAISSLLQITKYLKLSKEFPESQWTSENKNTFAKLFASLKEIPGIEKKLSLFEEIPPPEDIEELLPSVFKTLFSKNQTLHYPLPAGISKNALAIAVDYLKMEKSYKEASLCLSKAQTLLRKYHENPDRITSEDRLTLAELGKISKLSRFIKTSDEEKEEFFSLFKKLKMQKHPILKDYIKKIEQAKETMDDLEKILLPAFSEQYQDGDILGYSGKKKEIWTGRPLPLEEKLTMNIADYGLTHGMKVYHNENLLEVSHVCGAYEIRPMNLYESCISEGWRINLIPLIPEVCVKELQKTIENEEWQDAIQNLYYRTEKKIHQRNRERNMRLLNDEQRRMEAGLADFHQIINFFGGIKGKQIETHQLQEEQDFSEIYKHLLKQNNIQEVQICSEFVSKATLIALMKVNKKLATMISDKNPKLVAANVLHMLQEKDVHLSNDAKDYLEGIRHFGPERRCTKEAEKELTKILKNNGYSSQDIALMFRLNNQEIFDLPYSRKEDFSRIHPGRMVTLLEKKKCAQRIDLPAAFKQLIK